MRLRVVSIAAITLLSCQSKPTPAANDTFDRAALLQSVSDKVIAPAIAAAAAQAQTLAAATSRDELRAAWRTTLQAWQHVELMQVGPAAVVGTSTGAQGLRDTIYPWPVVNDCLVDQETLRKGYEASDFFGKALPAASGLAAIEYLLFRPDSKNACASFVGIGTQWDALSEDEIHARRLAYARVLAARVATQTQALEDAWAAHAPAFVASAQTGVDELFAAIFYLDLKVKDRKVAVPSGLSLVCGKASCPELAESKWALATRANLRSNLDAFAAVFTGADGVGFDDFLRARDQGALADTLQTKIDAARSALDALPGGEGAPLTEDLAAAHAVHAAIKEITDVLKTQLITVLNLRVPQEGAGDND